MPQTVDERRSPNHPTQKEWVPERWAYVGATVKSNKTDTTQPIDWSFKVKTWNRAGHNWVMLNADLDKVDYGLVDLKYNQVTIDIHDHLNWDFLDYTLVITGGMSKTINLPDDTDTYLITGLKELTSYTFNLKANLKQGGQTSSSTQSIYTPKNPIPLAPILTYTSATNIDINLTWTNPSGSTAEKYNVYAGVGSGEPWVVGSPGQGAMPTANKYWTCIYLGEDTPYYYQVAGINSSGQEGPKSNKLKIHTGHAAKYNQASISDEPLNVWEAGSWRNDIDWHDWHTWPTKTNQYSVFQGSYPTATTHVYRGCVTYDAGDFRNRLNSRWGPGTWENLNVTGVTLRRVYRMRSPGNLDAQYMVWRLTNTNVFDSGAPPIYDGHINDRNDADSWSGHYAMKAGTFILGLRLPRRFGQGIIHGQLGGTPINGIALYRDDRQNNGFGYSGYGEWCGHGRYDRAYSDNWRYSDWTMLITGNWTVLVRGFQGPYAW